MRQLSKHSRHSAIKLRRIIDKNLSHFPNDINNLSSVKHVIFDGTFIHGRKSIVAAMKAEEHEIFAGEYGIAENSIPQISAFLVSLKNRGLNPLSVTVDGNPQVIKAFKQIWPGIVIQRCVVHIQRQGLSWCRMKPKRKDTRELRNIFLKTNKIYNFKERNQYISDILAWEQQYGYSIARAPERGKIFSDIRRARSMLLRALPNMFHYLKDQNIPSSTNGIEGYFSRLKSRYQSHQGLSPKKRKNYFAWYFYLCKR